MHERKSIQQDADIHNDTARARAPLSQTQSQPQGLRPPLLPQTYLQAIGVVAAERVPERDALGTAVNHGQSPVHQVNVDGHKDEVEREDGRRETSRPSSHALIVIRAAVSLRQFCVEMRAEYVKAWQRDTRRGASIRPLA